MALHTCDMEMSGIVTHEVAFIDHRIVLLRYIKYDEWLAAMLEWQQLQQCEQWEQWVEEAFLHFDLDGAGHISKQGLSKMLCSGEQCAMPDTIAAALR